MNETTLNGTTIFKVYFSDGKYRLYEEIDEATLRLYVNVDAHELGLEVTSIEEF